MFGLSKKENEHSPEEKQKLVDAEFLKDEYTRLVKQAKMLLDIASLRNFTTLEAFDLDDEVFLQKLSEIVEDKRFLFFIHRMTMGVVANVTDGTPETAQIGQGILKGIDHVMRGLHEARTRYYAKQSERQLGQ